MTTGEKTETGKLLDHKKINIIFGNIHDYHTNVVLRKDELSVLSSSTKMKVILTFYSVLLNQRITFCNPVPVF